MKLKSFWIGLVVGVMVGPLWAAPLTLVEEGQPRATLVLGAAPTDEERAAAQDLQNYLRQMSGAEVPLRETDIPPATLAVLIGKSPAVQQRVGDLINEEHLGYDGFILKTFPQRLVVVGHQGQGTRFAAFALLEELGCRFFNPNPDGEYVPRRSTVVVPDLNQVSKPDFIHRSPWNNGHVGPTLTAETEQAWFSWFLKNRLGGIAVDHGHNYDGFCPHRLFEEHPDYFPYRRGEDGERRRVPEGQLCLTHPEVVERAIEAARTAFDTHPDKRSYSLSPNDTGGWCECDRCKAQDDPDPEIGLATRVLRFNNQVAAAVVKTHTGRFFPYYSEYGNMPGPPVRRDGTVVLQAHPAVMPAIVNIYCLLHDIQDPDCPRNAEYRWRLDAWSQVAPQLFMYEWLMYSDLPTPVTWDIGPRIRYYRDLGFLGYSGEILGRSPDNDLAFYIAAKMLWDADQDDRALIEEFFALYFQEAAEPMRAYYRGLNQVGHRPEAHRVRVEARDWTPAVVLELSQLLHRARQAARQPVVQRRVQREWTALQSHERCARALWCYRQWADQPTEPRLQETRRAVAAATAFLQEIAAQDVVAEGILLRWMERITDRLDAGVPPRTRSLPDFYG